MDIRRRVKGFIGANDMEVELGNGKIISISFDADCSGEYEYEEKTRDYPGCDGYSLDNVELDIFDTKVYNYDTEEFEDYGLTEEEISFVRCEIDNYIENNIDDIKWGEVA